MESTKLQTMPNGPIMVEGDCQILDSKGENYNTNGKTKLFLCRCGQSGDKPFCDGSHKEGFQDEAKANAQG